MCEGVWWCGDVSCGVCVGSVGDVVRTYVGVGVHGVVCVCMSVCDKKYIHTQHLCTYIYV